MSDFRPKQWVQRQFRDGIKRAIKDNGLIDTGAMYDSIDVDVSIDEFGVMTVEIYSVEYLKYHWERFNLDRFVDYGNFVWAAYAQWTAYKVEQNPMLTWNVTDPKIIFELNDF
jgi:hypothetical protein